MAKKTNEYRNRQMKAQSELVEEKETEEQIKGGESETFEKSQEELNDEDKPEWVKHQQEQTSSKSTEDHLQESETKTVKIKMLSNYRDVAKKDDIWETDNEKAEELVRLKRAEYVK